MTRTLPDQFTVLMARESDGEITLASEQLDATQLPDNRSAYQRSELSCSGRRIARHLPFTFR